MVLETAGADAAQMEVLELCDRLYGGLPESDRLLRMVFARVGFLQPQLFRRSPAAALAFLHAHPEVSALLLREVGARREEDFYPPGVAAGSGGMGMGMAGGGPGSGGPHHPHAHHHHNNPNYPNHPSQLFPPMERPVAAWAAVPGGRPPPPHYEPGRLARAHRW
ncbi:hypothetical protein SLS62_001285 [Diatrype stigma]|uniref:Uncharacterized protein n=1 Tax=Diatrype stigma TaxID=117547 RepID=A0AAN9UWM7_9PEZI